jgi:beta-lactamase regulating signal transducer with metallopeptidase domain
MIPHSIANGSSSFLLHVVDPALRSLVLAALAAIALRVLRVKDPAARLAVWSGVLYAALAMPLLGLALPTVSVPVPSTFAALLVKTTAASAPAVAAPLSASAATIYVVAKSEANAVVAPVKYSPAPRARVTRRTEHSETPVPAAAISTEVGQPATEVHVAAAAAPPPTVTPAPHRAYTWPLVAAVFCIVAAFMLGRTVLGAIMAARLARSADRIADPGAICILLRQARAAGVASAPRLSESDLVSVPVALGVLNPVILLPPYWRKWDEPTLAAVIAHEMSHIARRDALTQRLALVHRALFWFSPLAWWLNRSLADAAEEASDEAALLAGADRAFYAETLLGFFAALSENSQRRVYWQGVSMAAPGQAERRVDRILNWKGAISMRIRKSLAAGLILFGVPVALLTAAARPATTDDLTPAPPAPRAPRVPSMPALPPQAPQAVATPVPAIPQAAPYPVPAPAAPFLAQTAPLPSPAAPQVPGTPAAPPAPAIAPPAPVAPPDLFNSDGTLNKEKMDKFQRDVKDYAKDMKEFTYQFKDEFGNNFQFVMPKMDMQPFIYGLQNGPITKITTGDFSDRFVIVSDDSPIIMSGGSQDVEHATALRSTIKGDFIWFQHDEKSYIIRDQNLVNQAKAFYKPEQDLGAKQRDLGAQQRALGDQQRDLGQKMRDVHVTVPDMSADLQKLQDQLKQLSASGATEQQVGEAERQLGEMMRKLGQTHSQAGDQDRQIGEQMRQLGDKQRELGDQERELGHQQRDAAQQARVQMKQLLDDAISKGTAQAE